MNSDATLSGTCPTFRVITNSQLASHMTATQCIQPQRCCADDLIRFKASIRMEKRIRTLIYARRADRSILQPADLLGFFPFNKISKFKKGSSQRLIVNKKRINPFVKSRLVWRFLQNAAARVLSGAQKSQHITAILISLHWTAIKTAAKWMYVSFH